MQRIINLACGVALTVLPGCESVTAPTMASSVSPAPSAPAASRVQLEVSDLTATTAGSDSFRYDIRFLLTNMGRSSVVIERVTVEAEGASEESVSQMCWQTRIDVDVYESSNAFNGNGLGSCAPGIRSTTALREVRVTVFFVDALGRNGSVTATTPTVDLSTAARLGP